MKGLRLDWGRAYQGEPKGRHNRHTPDDMPLGPAMSVLPRDSYGMHRGACM
jgi:hypothetical protein